MMAYRFVSIDELLADFVAEPGRAPGGESGERMALLERILDALPPTG